MLRMSPPELSPRIASLSKAELHLHLEGSVQPLTLRTLMARYGIKATEAEVRQRYRFRNFQEFLEAFKWVTSFLREPQDYALVAKDLAEYLLAQNVIYAEVTLSVGVMLLRKQQPEATFEALVRATEPFERRGLRFRWVFDAVRQFGVEAAMAVV
jgi:aminodeoxyfutalosine deaminase